MSGEESESRQTEAETAAATVAEAGRREKPRRTTAADWPTKRCYRLLAAPGNQRDLEVCSTMISSNVRTPHHLEFLGLQIVVGALGKSPR